MTAEEKVRPLPPADQEPPLPSAEIPQVDQLEQVLVWVRAKADGADRSTLARLGERRHRGYLEQGARILGLLASDGPTPQGRKLATAHQDELGILFRDAFAKSVVGQAWLTWSGVETLQQLEATSAKAFLEARSELAPSTLKRRAAVLATWIRRLRVPSFMWPFPTPSGGSEPPGQLSLVAIHPPPPPPRWPEPSRFPHNEAGQGVRHILVDDFRAASELLMIVGYASLEEVLQVLASFDRTSSPRLRLLFGREPLGADVARLPRGSRSAISHAMRDYWLRRGISVLLGGAVLRVRELIDSGKVEVRTSPAGRFIHAKLYATERAVTLGSSNFTRPGLGNQSEANTRFQRSEERRRFDEANALGEGLWSKGEDFTQGFLDLLELLLKAVTWEEALARASAAVLEGEWARRDLPTDALARLQRPLWPHQLQGLAQALWILENVGSVLVADAAGSGKTRMGAWLVRGAFQRLLRASAPNLAPVLICPPQVMDGWKNYLHEAALAVPVSSHGPLSNPKAEAHQRLLEQIEATDLLVVDEAHNFLNWSERTRRLVAHRAEQTLLFTATPINKGPGDLLAMVELLGADNFSDQTLKLLKRTRSTRRRNAPPDDLSSVREEVRRFTVRRTRHELNRISEEAPEQQEDAVRARYPHHEARFYPLTSPPEDAAIAREIARIAAELQGVSRLGPVLELPAWRPYGEASYLRMVIGSARGLARYDVMDCLRSSRAALLEHIRGTRFAFDRFLSSHTGPRPFTKKLTGDMVSRIARHAGKPPRWALSEVQKEVAPPWLWDPAAHREACEHERARYLELADLAGRLSDAREHAKVQQLMTLATRHDRVICFDSHLISLSLFQALLHQCGVEARCFTGEGGAKSRKLASRLLGRETTSERVIALCSDALSEGMNLQAASCVVHLDTPTVIRVAEQRAGRVDRMDSRHERVEVWWPEDDGAFRPQKRDRLRERHKLVTDVIGANLTLPAEASAELGIQALEASDDTPLDVTQLAQETLPDRVEDIGSLEALFDAFEPIRHLVGNGGLVSSRVYQQLRGTQAEVVARVSLVGATEPWMFLALGGLDRVAPRWMFLSADGPTVALPEIEVSLRRRLGPGVNAVNHSELGDEITRGFLARVRDSERSLLPMRKVRALELLDQTLVAYSVEARKRRQRDLERELEALHRELLPSGDGLREPFAEPRKVAERWLALLRPRIRADLEAKRSRRTPWMLRNLGPQLLKEPFTIEELGRAFADIPLLEPVEQRVVAMIVGVPAR